MAEKMDNSCEEGMEALLFNYTNDESGKIMGQGKSYTEDKILTGSNINLNSGDNFRLQSPIFQEFEPVYGMEDDLNRNMFPGPAFPNNLDDINFDDLVTSVDEPGNYVSGIGIASWGNWNADYLDSPSSTLSESYEDNDLMQIFGTEAEANKVAYSLDTDQQAFGMNDKLAQLGHIPIKHPCLHLKAPESQDSRSVGHENLTRQQAQTQKRSRDNVNQRLKELANAFPTNYMVDNYKDFLNKPRVGSGEWTKADILKAAIDLIVEYRTENYNLQQKTKWIPNATNINLNPGSGSTFLEGFGAVSSIGGSWNAYASSMEKDPKLPRTSTFPISGSPSPSCISLLCEESVLSLRQRETDAYINTGSLDSHQPNFGTVAQSVKSSGSLDSGSANLLNRKQAHCEAQRRQRAIINNLVEKLEEVIPTKFIERNQKYQTDNRKYRKSGNRKWSDGAVLEAATALIIELRNENSRLRQMKRRVPFVQNGDIVFGDPYVPWDIQGEQESLPEISGSTRFEGEL